MDSKRFQSNQAWWRSKTDGRVLFFAVVDNNWPKICKPRPENVEHEFSCGFDNQRRYYAFADEQARDEFVTEWDSATVCEEPE